MSEDYRKIPLRVLKMTHDKPYWELSEAEKKKERVRKSDQKRTTIKGVCERCGTTENLQRHHPNYKRREFIVLCPKCHATEHVPNKKIHLIRKKIKQMRTKK